MINPAVARICESLTWWSVKKRRKHFRTWVTAFSQALKSYFLKIYHTYSHCFHISTTTIPDACPKGLLSDLQTFKV